MTQEKTSAFPINLHLTHLNEIGQLQKENRELSNFIEQERDFWEWLEDEIAETRKELWERYEKHRDETDDSIAPI